MYTVINLGPVTTSVQCFKCSTHKTVFSAVDPEVVKQYCGEILLWLIITQKLLHTCIYIWYFHIIMQKVYYFIARSPLCTRVWSVPPEMKKKAWVIITSHAVSTKYHFISLLDGSKSSFSLVRYGNTFIEHHFFKRLYSLHRRTYNANLVIQTAHQDWLNHYLHQKRVVFTSP